MANYIDEMNINGETYDIRPKKFDGLAEVRVFILDFVNDEVKCNHGAIDQARRKLTT